MSLDRFHPLIGQWFENRFEHPTEPQRLGWPHIEANRNTLIAAPTGSGKTMAAFLVCLDRLVRQWTAQQLEDEIQVVYVSPLKALSNDIERNLQTPLAEIARLAERAGLPPLPIRAAVRTGDTPASQRQSMLRRPPHILVTTPESLYLLVTSEKARQRLVHVKTVIVDEIHALARDKRGSHLALSLERLAELCKSRPTRIGLSATQRPIDQIGQFLVGAAESPCEIVDIGHARDLDLALEVPPSELSAVCSHEQWEEVYARLVELINSHRSTLVFVNTRRLAERVALHLAELLGEEAVASHHGSLSRRIRLSAEQRLKAGELRAIVATASLELGIDIGYIDLVCQIGSPRSIATFLQRVGRSGHSLGQTPKGRLFPLTWDELLESMALVRAVNHGALDCIEISQQPLDILTQQIIAEVASRPWDESELYELCRRAFPYRNLSRRDFDAVVKIASEGVAPQSRRGAYLHRDRIAGRLRARRHARLAALTSGGAIPESAEYRVVVEGDGTFVGTLDEDFAIESMAGDVFLLGNNSWRIRQIRGGEVVVYDAHGAPPTIPFWFGEAPGRTAELSDEISRLRADLEEEIGDREQGRQGAGQTGRQGDGEQGRAGETAVLEDSSSLSPALILSPSLLSFSRQCGASEWAIHQAVKYVAAQKTALGVVPTKDAIVFERFFDESGGMQLVIHSPLGAPVNRAWGLALRKRFCRSFDFELQAAADDNGIILSLSPQHSFPIQQLFKMLRTDNAQHLLEQAVLAVPLFQVRWRWNVTRALAVLRRDGGKKVPPHLQRFRSDDLLAASFPETVGCLENHHGDVQVPDHPLVAQTMHDCLHEAMDLDRWLQVLGDVEHGRVKLIPRDTREPSPFCYALLNANPYAFLDDAPLEERRTRAISTRRSLSAGDMHDLAALDSAAVAQVRQQAWPVVRDADELHDALMNLVVVSDSEAADWQPWLNELVGAGRATRVSCSGQEADHAAGIFWIAAERLALIESVFDVVVAQPPIDLPDELNQRWDPSQGWVEMVRGRVQFSGPIGEADLAAQLGLSVEHTHSALEALEGEGLVLRGQFTANRQPADCDARYGAQWCDRRLLARIHRLTLDGLRRQIQPVDPAGFLRFLARRHHLVADGDWSGPVAVRETVLQLQGFELPAGAWESQVLAARVAGYDPQWLDQLFFAGEATWGRLKPPPRDADRRPSAAGLSPAMPVSLMLREDLSWLLPADAADAASAARSNATLVLETLRSRGALFFRDLQAQTELLPGHLEEALRELAALGLITADSYSAVRRLVSRRKPSSSREGLSRGSRSSRRKTSSGHAPAGRWSVFPESSAVGQAAQQQPEDRLRAWCQQLLRRYGVVFRDLLARESAAPPWSELVVVLRRMELRGEARGGRFVSGVSGEQYATESAVTELRKVREADDDESWFVISAADPLNLAGIVTGDRRVPAIYTNRLIVRGGRYIAVRQAGEDQLLAEVDQAEREELLYALRVGHKRDAASTERTLLNVGAAK